MREDLIGFLLGSLDEAERAQIERELESSPALRTELAELAAEFPLPLDTSNDPPLPDNLGYNTCRLVDELVDELASEQIQLPESNVHASNITLASASINTSKRETGHTEHWRAADIFLMSGVVLAVAFLFFPSIAASRYSSQRVMCENNLRNVGVALVGYSESHGGQYPFAANDSKLAIAGAYGPILIDEGRLEDSQFLFCPGVEKSQGENGFVSNKIPSCNEIRNADGAELARLQSYAGGHYGYTLGHVSNGKVLPTHHEGRTHFAVMSDVPSTHLQGRQSMNHDGQGQNVLFDDGHVRFVTFTAGEQAGGQFGGDDIFSNRHGDVAPGADPSDAVVAPSHAPLWQQ